MPYSEKQIAEWAEATWRLLPVFLKRDRSIAVATLEGSARTLIAAVRKETREECARACDRLKYAQVLQQFNTSEGFEHCAETIRNLQEREEGKT